MSAFIVVLLILFIAGIGFAILRGFHFLDKKETLLAIGASYGLGVGLIGMQLYIYSRFNIPWQREFLFLPWVFLFGIVIIRNRKHIRIRLPKIPVMSAIEKALLIGILLTFCYVIFEALLRPVVAWDAWSDWLLYSKMFFIDGKINLDTLRYAGSGYPMTISLLGTYIYIFLGHVDDTTVLLISTAFYIFLAIAFFAVLKERYGVRYALLFTLLMVSTQNFVRHGGRLEAGMADLPLGYFAFLSVIFLFSYFKQQTVKTLLLFTVFLSITALIKYEGIPLSSFIAFCAFIYIIKKRFFKHLFILFLWILPFILWQIDRRLMGIENTYFSVAHPFEFGTKKSINAFSGTFKELVNIKSWNVLWISYFYTLVVFGIRKQPELAVLHFIILSQLSLYLIVYNITFGNNPESSIERLLMHIAPLAFLCIAFVVKIIFKNKKFIF
jgi:hypothetical protein